MIAGSFAVTRPIAPCMPMAVDAPLAIGDGS
jgi:hypothetical protein